MKKCIHFSAVLLLACMLLSACGAPGEKPEATNTVTPVATNALVTESSASSPTLPEEFPMVFTFSSGAGAWRTYLILQPDGTFSGQFSDSNMGESGEGYPNGTVYLSDFSGKFQNIEKVNAYTYSMRLDAYQTEKPSDTEWIEEGVRYVSSDPYGLVDGKNFLLYTPEAPIEDLDTSFLSWWPGRYAEEDTYQTLSSYGLYNVETGDGFFTDLP